MKQAGLLFALMLTAALPAMAQVATTTTTKTVSTTAVSNPYVIGAGYSDAQLIEARDMALLDLASDYPAAQQAPFIETMKRYVTVAKMRQVEKAAQKRFTAAEIEKIRTDPSFAQTPAIDAKLRLLAVELVGNNLLELSMAFSDLSDQGIPPPKRVLQFIQTQ